ncbi:RHS repeat-associated core domain-containing protein [Micromonospora sp. NPDC005367]|uniref:RHS repeat-associated core domain-containing protein n=1 Tax=Micromonospora sp. NPDC005367 TaxID=3155590 RepID=UPI0033B26E34
MDKPDTADPTKEPYNAYRFNAKRRDQGSGNYDMGFRDYSPGLNRFLSRDRSAMIASSTWSEVRFVLRRSVPVRWGRLNPCPVLI